MGAHQGMGTHQSAQAKSDIWLTPRHILDALGAFDLDPCSAPDPALWPTAAEHITLPVDGLSAPWRGRVWLNPPYGQRTWRWLDRLAQHGDGVALVFARTETAGFAAQVWGRADAVLFLTGRLTFHNPDGSVGGGNAGAPSCLIAYGAANARVLERCGLPGVLVSGWRTTSETPDLFTQSPDDGSDVAGYWVLNRENPEVLWDGTLHPSLEAGREQLNEATSSVAEYGTGWYLVECREVVS